MKDVVGPWAPHLIEAELGDELSLYDPRQERVIALNTSASDVWRLATGEFDIAEITDRLAGAYGTDSQAIRADVESIVAELRAQGLFGAGET